MLIGGICCTLLIAVNIATSAGEDDDALHTADMVCSRPLSSYGMVLAVR